MQVEFGFAGRKSCDFDIFPFDSGCPARAERFECSFLGGKPRSIVDLGLRTFLAVFDLTFCIYSIEKAVAEALKRIAYSIVLDNVDADPGDHRDYVTGKT